MGKPLRILKKVAKVTGAKLAANIGRKVVNRIGDIAHGIRTDYPPKVREILSKIGHYEVTGITLGRKPVNGALLKALNVMSMGDIKKQIVKHGYDNVYHLFMIYHLRSPNSGKELLLKNEKNEVINMGVKTQVGDYEKVYVPVNQKVTLAQYQENAARAAGKGFFLYNSYKNNCQVYISNLLKHNNNSTQQSDGFIMQDILPKGGTRVFAKKLTNLGALANVAMYGR